MAKPLDRWRPSPTAIVVDMQTTARGLGIVDLLLAHRKNPTDPKQLEEALLRLGATDSELAAYADAGRIEDPGNDIFFWSGREK